MPAVVEPILRMFPRTRWAQAEDARGQTGLLANSHNLRRVCNEMLFRLYDPKGSIPSTNWDEGIDVDDMADYGEDDPDEDVLADLDDKQADAGGERKLQTGDATHDIEREAAKMKQSTFRKTSIRFTNSSVCAPVAIGMKVILCPLFKMMYRQISMGATDYDRKQLIKAARTGGSRDTKMLTVARCDFENEALASLQLCFADRVLIEVIEHPCRTEKLRARFMHLFSCAGCTVYRKRKKYRSTRTVLSFGLGAIR